MIEKEYLEPNEGFSQTVVVKTGNFKTIYISGQIGDGDDLEAQNHCYFSKFRKATHKLQCYFQRRSKNEYLHRKFQSRGGFTCF